jgi:hypothetical protein
MVSFAHRIAQLHMFVECGGLGGAETRPVVGLWEFGEVFEYLRCGLVQMRLAVNLQLYGGSCRPREAP